MAEKKLTFQCNTCDKLFKALPRKEEHMHPIYGACWKYIADCPACGEECSEYREPKTQKAAPVLPAMPPCGQAATCQGCQYR